MLCEFYLNKIQGEMTTNEAQSPETLRFILQVLSQTSGGRKHNAALSSHSLGHRKMSPMPGQFLISLCFPPLLPPALC